MKVRLWKLGDLEKQIVPTQNAVNKLRDILAGLKDDEGFVDIVWGPELNVEEHEVANMDGCPVTIVCDDAQAEQLRDVFKKATQTYVDARVDVAIKKFLKSNSIDLDLTKE